MHQLSATHHRAEISGEASLALGARDVARRAHQASRCHTQTKMTGIDGVS
jgi:hypothetical protein